MIEIVWEFVVKEEARGKFELAYGPGGAWSKLFASCPGYRGTTILRDITTQNKYLTIDMWDTLDQREQMLADHEDEYTNLEASFAEWIEAKAELGIFRVVTEATVKPLGKARRRKRSGPH